MSEYVKSGLVQRLVALTAAGAIAVGGAVFVAPTASADDYELTDDEVIAQIESEPWPTYTVEDEEPNIDIRGAQRFLEHLPDLDAGPPTSYFDEAMEDMVLDFQDTYDLERNGELDYGTWVMLRQVHFPEGQDSYGPSSSGDAVRGIQELANHKFGDDLGFELDVTGEYNEETYEAVEDIQTHLDLHVDGEFGRLTMRAVFTYADYEVDAAALEAEEGVEGAAEEGAEEAAEEGAEADEAEEAQEDGEAAETDEVEADDEQDSDGEAEATEQSQE